MAEVVLIVEDEPDLREMLEFNLRQEGFETATAASGADAVQIALANPPDVILLDLMLPDMAGTEVCRKLRSEPATAGVGIIMVTARAEEIDRVVGFELGADDYVVKPFSVRELVLRVRSLLRRKQPPSAVTSERIAIGELRIDPAAHRVWVEDAEVGLTALEFRLLGTLLQRRGNVQTRERLLEDVWDMDGSITTRTVDTHVKRLREKLGRSARFIETVRGVGYRFRDDDE